MTDDLPLLLTRCISCGRQTAAAPFVRLRKLSGHGKYASTIVFACQHCGEVAHRGNVHIGQQTMILGIRLVDFPVWAGDTPAYGILNRHQIARRHARPYRKKKAPD